MVLTYGSMPTKASMPHAMHMNAGYSKSVAGSGKLGFSKAVAEAPFGKKKGKKVQR